MAVTITAPEGTAIAMFLTDRSGKTPVAQLPVPDTAASQTPDTGERPFALVTVHARLRGYEDITAENVQVFPDTTTLQDLEMIPLPEFPRRWDAYERFNTPPQNL